MNELRYELKVKLESEDDMDNILDVLDEMDADGKFVGGISVITSGPNPIPAYKRCGDELY